MQADDGLSYSQEHQPIDETTLHDQQDEQRSILPSSLLARYSRVLRRRRDEQASGRRAVVLSRANLKVLAAVFWALLAIGIAVLTWRTVVYAGRLSRYIEFVRSGVPVQAIAIGRRSAKKTTRYSPHRYTITYGFWVGDRRVIRIEGVSQQTYEAQIVDDPVTVVYLPRDPRISRIRRELVMPWPVEPVAILVGCVATFVIAYRTSGRLKRQRAESKP